MELLLQLWNEVDHNRRFDQTRVFNQTQQTYYSALAFQTYNLVELRRLPNHIQRGAVDIRVGHGLWWTSQLVFEEIRHGHEAGQLGEWTTGGYRRMRLCQVLKQQCQRVDVYCGRLL